MVAKNRLTNLSIDEVSLVDHAAIQEKFLILKADGDAKQDDSDDDADADAGEDIDADAIATAALDGTDADDEDEGAEEKDGEDDMGDEKDKDAEGSAAKPDEGTVTKAELGALMKAAVAEEVEKVTKVYEEQLNAATSQVTDLRKEAATAQFRTHAIEKKWPGSADDNAATAMTMKENLPDEAFTKWLEGEDARAEQDQKSALYKEFGTARTSGGDGGDAGTALEKSMETMRKEGKSVNEISDAVDKGEYAAAQRVIEEAARNRSTRE